MAGRRDLAPIRVLVLGDDGVGKTTLIQAHITDHFPEEKLDVLEPVEIPRSEHFSRTMTVIDTPNSLAHDETALRSRLHSQADIVLLLYAVDDKSTFFRLQTYWLPIIEQANAQRRLPVLVLGTKADLGEELAGDRHEQFLALTHPLLTQFHCAEMAMECSAKTMIKGLHEVFTYACRTVEYPVPPLYDVHERRVSPKFEKALKRIFRLCDEDRDNLLSGHEVTEFQDKCFGVRLGKEDTQQVFKVLAKEAPKGVTDRGISEYAFKKLMLMFITQSRPQSTWAVLRYYHYNNQLDLEIPPALVSVDHDADQNVELNNAGLRFLTDVFEQFNEDRVLPPGEMDHIWSIAPSGKHPFGAHFPGNTHARADGSLRLSGWLAIWSMYLCLDERAALESLYVLGALEPTKVTELSSKRRDERRYGGRLNRRTLRCFVVGDSRCGKSSMIMAFLRRRPAEMAPTLSQRNSVIALDEDSFMVFTEVPADAGMGTVEACDPACDVLCLCYKAGSAASFAYVQEAVTRVPRHVPVVIIQTCSDIQTTGSAKLLAEATEFTAALEISPPYLTQATKHGAECLKLPALLKQVAQDPSIAEPVTEDVRVERRRAWRNKLLLGAVVVVGLAAAGGVGLWWFKKK